MVWLQLISVGIIEYFSQILENGMFINMLNEKLWKTCDWTFIRKVAAVEGNSYEFSDDTFANDEPKPDESLDFEPTFSCRF